MVLVRKSYEEKRRRQRAKGAAERRPWKLKTLNMEVEEGAEAAGGGGGRRAARTQGAADITEAERERFLQVHAEQGPGEGGAQACKGRARRTQRWWQEEVKGALGQVTLAMENLMGHIFHASEVASEVATRETATS